MNRRITTAVLTVAIAAASLTACGNDDSSTNSKKAQPTAAPSAPAAPQKPLAEAEAKVGIPPKPDAATQTKYIAALNAISPAIVGGKEDRAVSRGRDTCGTVHAFPSDRAKQVNLTKQRFSGSHQVTTPEAEKILATVTAHLCPKG
ncbi:hypothetical protein [Streptomyces chrestomyceticus]|uniref:DUF732 domain-containing protein n=1 Tax=Streptomyces chrestomyceticus TaxID=68185 RepID=A0ABU7WSL5_9ACTN